MTVLVYATSADLAKWPGVKLPLPENVDGQLMSASLLVGEATMTAVYDTTAEGMPTAPAVREAVREATCAQAATWLALGVDPTAGAAQAPTAPVQHKQIGSASLTYDTAASASVTALQARTTAVVALCRDAARILARAGLTAAEPWTP